ncbi:hypothetical protein V1264_005890 [Littorina saxatilis]|uniref:Uncharacterized protein n=1 Tax=Littorina saxatilis TaxID=31220 RepID=A0AAN9B0U2_9CAEN
MTKDTFEVKLDQTTGKQYVIKRFDELTKNHRAGDEELVTGVMPETGDSSCPVYSYNKYLSLLNPKCERLWQFPVNTFHGDDETWYDNRPMGVHTMKKCTAKLSELCQLSQIYIYTNHSVRATGATLLAGKNFSPIDIISVTGHKTVNSLQPYQKTSTAKKLEMAAAMSSQLTENRQSQGEPAGTWTGSRIERGRLVASAIVTSQQTIRQDVELRNDEVAALFDPEYEPAMPPTRQNPPMFHHCDLSHAPINIQFH